MDSTSAPAWFRSAIETLPERHSCVVDGIPITYRTWGDPELPALILVHGGAAHAGWWDHIAPQLTSHRVVAPDLSGHGDSGRRPAYEVDTWAGEIIGVARDQRLVKPIVFGHSMGGWVAVAAGALYPDEVAAVAVLDSPLHDQPPEEDQLRLRMRPTRIYPTKEAALARFSTLPTQDLVLSYVSDHIAPASLHEVEGGWTWKFDPRFFGRRLPLRDMLPKVGCPAAMFRCEHGMVTTEMVTDMRSILGSSFACVEVPAAGHHAMLDQPLALVTGLRTLLALWP